MLRIDLRDSWALASILLFAHGAAIAAIWVSGIPFWLQLAAATALTANLWREIVLKALLRSRGAIVAIEIAADNALSVQTRRGEWIACEVRGDTYVSWFLTIVNLRRLDSKKRVSVVLLPDAIGREDFRRLRVWLRWKQDAKTTT